MNIAVGVAVFDRPEKAGKMCRCNSLGGYWFRALVGGALSSFAIFEASSEARNFGKVAASLLR